MKTIAPANAVAKLTDPQTHTGQSWKEDDYRLARFEGTPKQINTHFAVDLIAAEPVKKVKARIVMCDGGGGPLGHPKVYINLDQPGDHVCSYCGRGFTLDDYDHHHHHDDDEEDH